MKIIFNADDFGLSKAVNYGILEAYRCGAVRSTTLMSNMPAFYHALEISKHTPGLSVGVHLTLTMGKSLTGKIEHLTDTDGRFFKQAVFFDSIDKIDPQDVKKEYRAQVKKALEAGFKLTHLDGHHHNQGCFPKQFAEICAEFGLKARKLPECEAEILSHGVASTDSYSSNFYDKAATFESLIEFINEYEKHGCDSLELMCHPAFVDLDLMNGTGYNINRINEYKVLTDERLMAFIDEKGHKLCGFDGI